MGLEQTSYTAVKTEEKTEEPIEVCIVMANGCYAALPIRVRTLNNSAGTYKQNHIFNDYVKR